MATIKEIRILLANDSSTCECVVSHNKGLTIIRKGFYYTSGYTSAQFSNKITNILTKAGITIKVVGHGEVWKPFRGGASVAQSSHWWVKIE